MTNNESKLIEEVGAAATASSSHSELTSAISLGQLAGWLAGPKPLMGKRI